MQLSVLATKAGVKVFFPLTFSDRVRVRGSYMPSIGFNLPLALQGMHVQLACALAISPQHPHALSSCPPVGTLQGHLIAVEVRERGVSETI